MENKIIFMAGMKRHRGSLLGIAILLFLVSLSLTTVLAINHGGGSYLGQELTRAGFGNLTAWVSQVPDMDDLTESIRSQAGIADARVQRLVFSEYEANGVESDSEGQLLPWTAGDPTYRFFRDDLRGYKAAPEAIAAGQVYVSPSMVTMMDMKIGDTITFPVARNGNVISLTVAGFYEDPLMGSSMIGMKGFLISESDYAKIFQTVQETGMDSLAKDGAMIHIFLEDGANVSISQITGLLDENTAISQYTEFIHSVETMEGFMMILQNAFSGLLAAFALVLLGTAMVILGHSITGVMEQEYKNLGILKTIGFTGRRLMCLQLAQYMAAAGTGLLAGMLAGVFAAKAVCRMTLTTNGILIPARLPLPVCLAVLIVILILLAGFTVQKLRRISEATPMRAIRGETVPTFKRQLRGPGLGMKGLALRLAARQLISGGKRYISACIVATLLVFFASLAGRMNDWLGPEGKGMMDAFNPADLDIGVQAMGELSVEAMEHTIRSYTDITDSYLLAMPSVSVNGTNYTANVITDPERFHMSQGETCRNADEVVLTEAAAADLGVTTGDRVTLRGDAGRREFTVSGIYHCANDMGANIGMNREGYLSIGQDDQRLWCHHYFLDDPSQKEQITQALEAAYGGDVHVHENSWPGLFGIISAMHGLLFIMYVMIIIFVFIVTGMTGSRVIAAEQKDMGIYKSIGCASGMLRGMFALRFGMVSVIGAVLGTILAAVLTDPLVSAVMRLAGISNFASRPGLLTSLIPGAVVAALFLGCAWLVSGRIKKTYMAVLTSE